MEKVLDIRNAKKISRGYDLAVKLRKNYKGTSLFARKPIKKGKVIAYYKFLVHKYTDSFHGYKKGAYVISIYKKNGHFNPHVIGDIYEGSLVEPKYNIPFWAYFSNEPSKKQKENCELDINLKGNYRKRNKVKSGDSMVYKLRATRDIKSGEEICWCYGGSYGRKYIANCS